MQKFIIILFINLILLGCSNSDKVYICNGPRSEAYHKSSLCQGLRKCSTEIEATDIDTAKEKNRRTCGYCYK